MDSLLLRIVIFFVGFTTFTLLGEYFILRKSPKKLKFYRWINNTALTFLNSSILGLCFAGTLVFFVREEAHSSPLAIIFSVVFLDFLVYWQHRLFHKIPLLWKLHRVHHSDVEMDTTTALRFHPLEIVISFFVVKMGSITLIKLDPLSLLIFEILLNLSAMFNHGNFSLPLQIERFTRIFIITPDLHRIHHSVVKKETNSNFGFFLSIWDKIFGSYRPKTLQDQETMPIGLEDFRSQRDQGIHRLLLQPLRTTSPDSSPPASAPQFPKTASPDP